METIKIAFVGDVFPGGVLHDSSSDCLSTEVSDYLKGFDVRVGNLEAAMGEGFSFDEDKMRLWSNIIYAKDEDVRRIKEMGLDVVSLANNHVTDLGPEGLLNTITLLDANGIRHFGAGRNIQEAESPAVVTIRERQIAFLGFYDTKVAPHPASEESPGVCTSGNIVDRIREAKRMYDYVFVLPHWGFENIYRPLPEMKRLGYEMINAGADGVIGSHTHHIQPYVVYKKRPLFFSLGNFLFPDFYQQPPRPIWYPDPSVDLSGIPSVYDYRRFVDRPVKCVWRRSARIGLVGEVSVSNRTTASYRLTYLDDTNRITFLAKQKKRKLALFCLGLIVRSPLYTTFFFLSECLFFIKRRLSPKYWYSLLFR